MGRASRAKRERRENAPKVPHFEVLAGLAAAESGTGNEQDREKD